LKKWNGSRVEAEGQMARSKRGASPSRRRGITSKRRSQLPFCLAPSRVALILALACVARLAEIAADIGTALRALATTKIHRNAAHSSFSTVSREINMSDIITERSGNILRVELNRPAKKNAMTLAMYITLADLFNDAAKDDQIRVVLWHGAGDSFSAGNDIQDFLKNPPGPGKSPQAELIDALINFDKPIVAAVQGAAIGGGTTMLTHCDFVFAGESAKFRMPFVDLAVVPEFGTSYSVPARIGYLRAAELVLLGLPFDAKRAAALGLVTRVVADQLLLPTATGAAQQLAAKPPASLQSCKRLMRSSTRELLERAVKLENQEFATRVRSAEAKEAFTAFLEKRRPDFTKTNERANPKAQAA
jgi:enoyl-CoA hydratase/carnithine racemase